VFDAEGPLLLDGGMGSALIIQGLKPGQAPEEWLLDHPDRVLSVHRAFVAAGCDIIQSNSFGGNPARLARSDRLAGLCGELNTIAINLARAAAGSTVLVAGNIGPAAVWLEEGTEDLGGLQQQFGEQAQALASAGADLIAIETMCDLQEALAAVRAAVATGLPVFASMCFKEEDGGFCSLAGDSIEESLQALAEAGANAVGFNCNLDSSQTRRLAEQALGLATLPLVLQPCAGQPAASADGPRYPDKPAEFAHNQLAAIQAGAAVVGGCCGTTPEFIATLRSLLDAEGASHQNSGTRQR